MPRKHEGKRRWGKHYVFLFWYLWVIVVISAVVLLFHRGGINVTARLLALDLAIIVFGAASFLERTLCRQKRKDIPFWRYLLVGLLWFLGYQVLLQILYVVGLFPYSLHTRIWSSLFVEYWVFLWFGLPFFILSKPKVPSVYTSFLPVVVFYVAYDVYTVAFGRVPGIWEMFGRHTFHMPLSVYWVSGIALLVAIVIALCKPCFQPKRLLFFALWFILTVIAGAIAGTGWPLSVVKDKAPWDRTPAHVVRTEGRAASLFTGLANRKRISWQLGRESGRIPSITPVPETYAGELRNVYVFALRGFVDVDQMRRVHELFKGQKDFGDQPVLAYLGQPGRFILPNGTHSTLGRSLLEVLCGVPSLEQLGWWDTDLFATSGNSESCLPHTFNKRGYVTRIYGKVPSDFAQRLGFSRGKPLPSRVLSGRDAVIYRWARHDLENTKKPHFSFFVLRDYTSAEMRKFGPVVPRRKREGKTLWRLSNNYVRRLRSLYHMLVWVRRNDPKALIVVFGLNMPRHVNYAKLGYFPDIPKVRSHTSSGWVINGGETEVYPLLPLYDVYKVIWNDLSDGAYCRNKTCHLGPHGRRIGQKEWLDYLRLVKGVGH